MIIIIAGACRLRVISKFSKEFHSPVTAAKHYFGVPQEPSEVASSSDHSSDHKAAEQPVGTCEMYTQTENLSQDDVGWEATSEVMPTPLEELQTITTQFCKFALTHYQLDVNGDFLLLALRSFQHLKNCSRSNVLYGLAQAIGTNRPDGTDSS